MTNGYEKRKLSKFYELRTKGLIPTRAKMEDGTWDWVSDTQVYTCGVCKGGKVFVPDCTRCANTGNIFGGEEVEKKREERQASFRTEAANSKRAKKINYADLGASLQSHSQKEAGVWNDEQVHRKVDPKGHERRRKVVDKLLSKDIVDRLLGDE